VIVKKKDSTNRVCVDYGSSNEISLKDVYPLPIIDGLFQHIVRFKYFSKINLRLAYHQIRLRPLTEQYTVFRCLLRTFKYMVLLFSLSNAPSHFQHVLEHVIKKHLNVNVFVYLDDILAASRQKTIIYRFCKTC
jgi:Cdc6-like AAA superfamily ATPase